MAIFNSYVKLPEGNTNMIEWRPWMWRVDGDGKMSNVSTVSTTKKWFWCLTEKEKLRGFIAIWRDLTGMMYL